MYSYIRKLQSKDEHTRKRILIGSLVVCMSIVGFLWITSLGYKFGDNSNDDVVSTENTIRPFALFGKSITNTVDNVSASVGNISSKTFNSKRSKNEKQIDLIPVEIQ